MDPEAWPDFNRVVKFPVLVAVAGVYLGARAIEIVWRSLRK